MTITAATADLLVILRHGPYGSSWLREGLDVSLVAAAFGQKVSLMFLGEGVLALMPGQAKGAPGQKATAPIIDMLAMYDIDRLLVCSDDLQRMGLQADELCAAVEVISGENVSAELDRHRSVFNF
ncbi:sulfurtransferase complex subunit TusC [Vreelandella rituensis]|uniref:Sulfurtransferase complex subunit TusC n=1 Tax=Vreelandella rituensis TaxID=2282306 RepID=A0A368U4U2_9GAMM|nr:sulfurtransferase complex subunit TusC [Halomonas rituensis]RCV92128.1 sulfurtransferase complex subunit TusC [Halomonas rituensis]